MDLSIYGTILLTTNHYVLHPGSLISLHYSTIPKIWINLYEQSPQKKKKNRKKKIIIKDRKFSVKQKQDFEN